MQFKKYLFFLVSFGVLVLGVAVVSAVTTISANLSTGDLTVTGTAAVTGASTLSGNVYVGGKATTTAASGNIATDGSLTIGSNGTAITKMVCISTTTDWAAFSVSSHCQWGTTTMTGLTASADGGWGMTISPVATTSGLETVNVGFSLTAYPTSTNVVEIRVCNASSTDTTNLPAQRYEICGIKH